MGRNQNIMHLFGKKHNAGLGHFFLAEPNLLPRLNIKHYSIALFMAFFFANQAIVALADGAITVVNDFNSDALEGVRFVMSGHEHRRMHVENEKLVLGVRDTLLTENEYIPTEEKPLELSLAANFQENDALYLLTRSQGTTDIGGYRSNDEVRVLIDSAERLISINEVHEGKIKVVRQINDVAIPLYRDIPIRLKDNGHSVTITLGEYTVSGSPQGSYPQYFVGISNWAKIVTVDNLIIAHGAGIPPSQDEDEFILNTKLNNQALQRLQGAQLLEKSVFAISGNDIGARLQERMPDIFPENLQLAVMQWAKQTGEPGGRYQDLLLRQQSEYRGILRSLLGSYDNNMIGLLNYAIERVVRIQFGESEHDLLQEIRDAVAAQKRTRYMIELASFGIQLPSPEELYREAQRLFTDEQAILRHMQEEDARLDKKDQLLASDREWQLLHNISDLNDTERGISEDEQRRLDRAQRRMQEALRIRGQGQEDAPLTFGQSIVIDPAIFVFPDKNTPLKEKESERHTTYQWAGPEEDSSDYMMWKDNKYNDSIIIKAVVPKTDASDDELPSLNMFSPDMAYSEYYIRANIPNGGLKPPYLASARAFRDMREELPDDFENILRKCPILGYIPYYTELAGNACKASEDCFYDEDMAWCASEVGIVAMPTLSISDVLKGIQQVSQYSVRIIKPGNDWLPFYQRFHNTPNYPDLILMLFKGEAQKNSLIPDTVEDDGKDELITASGEVADGGINAFQWVGPKTEHDYLFIDNISQQYALSKNPSGGVGEKYFEGYIMGNCEHFSGFSENFNCITFDVSVSSLPVVGVAPDARDAVLYCPRAIIKGGDVDAFVCVASLTGAVNSLTTPTLIVISVLFPPAILGAGASQIGDISLSVAKNVAKVFLRINKRLIDVFELTDGNSIKVFFGKDILGPYAKELLDKIEEFNPLIHQLLDKTERTIAKHIHSIDNLFRASKTYDSLIKQLDALKKNLPPGVDVNDIDYFEKLIRNRDLNVGNFKPRPIRDGVEYSVDLVGYGKSYDEAVVSIKTYDLEKTPKFSYQAQVKRGDKVYNFRLENHPLGGSDAYIPHTNIQIMQNGKELLNSHTAIDIGVIDEIGKGAPLDNFLSIIHSDVPKEALPLDNLHSIINSNIPEEAIS